MKIDFICGDSMDYKIIQASTEEDYKICDNFMTKLINFESMLDPMLNSGVVVNGFSRSVCGEDSYLAYIMGKSPIGFTFAHLKHKKGKVNARNVIEIETLYVDENYRRQGFATMLIQAIEDWCKEKYGDCCIEITTLQNNEVAKDTYSHLGYNPVRTTLRKNI